jgi:cyclomaltodextrinase
MKSRLSIFALIVAIALVPGCKNKSPDVNTNLEYSTDSIHQRLADGVIYEVNIRQITPEGTFKAFTDQHIDRLKKLGVDILWLMPIYPISVKNRKGSLGSYYSVADYKDVNPEFGTPGAQGRHFCRKSPIHSRFDNPCCHFDKVIRK